MQSAFPKLAINGGCCNGSNVVVRFKTLVKILMAVLALGIGVPQPGCVAGISEAGKACCCTESPICKCHPDKLCNQSCTQNQVQTFDKQLPARGARASLHGDILLFSIAPTKVKYLVLVPAVHQRDLDASPPFGGSPPQARLCLWLI
jgi:hypothetical protein